MGIATEGKELREIAKEVRETISNKAKELGIKQKERIFAILLTEVNEASIRKDAKEFGIATEGKGITLKLPVKLEKKN